MRRAASLRTRLTLIILVPILLIAIAAGLWQLNNARQTAAEVFSRSLLSAALAVAGDVAISDGDALSARTRDILADTSGGQVFYHVYAPDGVIVAGYATPPVGIPLANTFQTDPSYFNATYLGRSVSGVRLQTITEIEGFSGTFTTTVWQDTAVREAFVRDLIARTAIVITGLIAALSFVVWFGIRIGLRPLLNLEEAIAQRSSDELNPIRRAVPTEVSGIVQTLNRLFQQVSQSMNAQNDFISNAAHQLRNPIAGVLALAQATEAAPTFAEAKRRSADLVDAANATADLSAKLLLMERAKAISPDASKAPFDLAEALSSLVADMRPRLRQGVQLEVNYGAGDLPYVGDQLMLMEAIRNLVQNALVHGGDALTKIEISAAQDARNLILSVRDDGVGVAEAELPNLRERFTQAGGGAGSGLGVSIVEAVAQGHGGTLDLQNGSPGLIARLILPRAG